MRKLWVSAGQALACLAFLFVVVFHPVLFQGRQFAFQDAGHYYYPLLERVQQEWDAGRWPLWAPEASAGTPLLGNPTAAVLYPGKLLFFWLPFPWAVRLFLVGHVALAYGAMWTLLRSWQVSPVGSILGSLAYAFGVPVLSQTSNMIFLVGAAWAPLGFLAADLWIRCGRRLALPALALVLALQVLGGDPETAYVIVVCAGGYAMALAAARSGQAPRIQLRRAAIAVIPVLLALLALSWWGARVVRQMSAVKPGDPAPTKPPSEMLAAIAWGVVALLVVRRARTKPAARAMAALSAGLVAASAVALALTGAQLLPVLEYSGMSFRAAVADGFHDYYAYSAHPLQALDAIWPNVFGTLEGGYRSWLNALPPKYGGRLWMPSIYLGGLTMVLAASAAGLRGGPPWRAWLTVVAVASFLAALGYHASPLLWARCVPGWQSVLGPLEPPFNWQLRSDGYLRDGDGSVYWLLASGLPGFRSFRYPPKLFVVWALAVSGLAGAGWDRLVAGRSRRTEAMAAVLLLASVAALATSWLWARPLQGWFDGLAWRLRNTDEPLDVARALRDLRAGLGHGVVVAVASLGVVVLAGRRPRLAGAFAVAALSIDLGWANAYHVITVPQAAFEGVPRALRIIEEAERADPSPGPFRVARVGRWWPIKWSVAGSPRSYEAITRWERNSLRHNYNLPLSVRLTFFYDTLEPLDYGLFFLPWMLTPDAESLHTHSMKAGQKVWYHPRRGFDLWNSRYFIVPGQLIWDNQARGYASFIHQATELYPGDGAFKGPGGEARRKRWLATEDYHVLRNEAAYPRAWIVHRAHLLPRIRGLRVSDRMKVQNQLIYQADKFWRVPGVPVRDPHTVAWVETDAPEEVEPFLSRADPDPAESVTVVRDEPQRVELKAELRSPGLVVVSDMFYPGWTVSVDGQPAEILRTNRAMRGVALPAGTHRLVFRYEPWSFRLGCLLSLAGLAAFAGLVVWGIRPRRRRPSPPIT